MNESRLCYGGVTIELRLFEVLHKGVELLIKLPEVFEVELVFSLSPENASLKQSGTLQLSEMLQYSCLG
jgi:hypothetical protein